MKLKTLDEITSSEEYQDFKALCYSMKNRILAAFLRKWLSSSSDAGRRYFTSPGSRPGTGHGHHAFEGGLAIHSIKAASLAKNICRHYIRLGESIDMDLVVAGVLIHDIGKD